MKTFLFTSSISNFRSARDLQKHTLSTSICFLKYQLVKTAMNSEMTKTCVKGKVHDLLEEISLK